MALLGRLGLDRLFGGDEPSADAIADPVRTTDARVLERYRSLLRTAPPETIELVHAEAFARLTEGQRALVYEELSRGAGTGERPLSSEPATLARAAVRAEQRHPGTIERSLSGSTAGITPGAPAAGSVLASTMLGTVAGDVVGSALASAFLPWDDDYEPPAPAAASGAVASDGDGDAGGAGA